MGESHPEKHAARQSRTASRGPGVRPPGVERFQLEGPPGQLPPGHPPPPGEGRAVRVTDIFSSSHRPRTLALCSG